MLSTWVVPSRPQGNPVMRVRASSTATQTTGESSNARRLKGLLPASRLTNRPNDAVVNRQIEAEKNQNADSGRHVDAAVLMHDAVNPIAGAGIPQNPADVRQHRKPAAGLAGSSLIPARSCSVSGCRARKSATSSGVIATQHSR